MEESSPPIPSVAFTTGGVAHTVAGAPDDSDFSEDIALQLSRPITQYKTTLESLDDDDDVEVDSKRPRIDWHMASEGQVDDLEYDAAINDVVLASDQAMNDAAINDVVLDSDQFMDRSRGPQNLPPPQQTTTKQKRVTKKSNPGTTTARQKKKPTTSKSANIRIGARVWVPRRLLTSLSNSVQQSMIERKHPNIQ
jgi:hypothetical protein